MKEIMASPRTVRTIIGNVFFSFSLRERIEKVTEPTNSKIPRTNMTGLSFMKVSPNNIKLINANIPFFIFKQSLVSLYFCLFLLAFLKSR